MAAGITKGVLHHVLVAEALAKRKAILKNMSELESRISAAAVTYEDEKPEDDAEELVVQLHAQAEEFEKISTAINETNNSVALTFDGRTLSLMEAVALRENLLLRQRSLRRIAEGIDNALGKGKYGYGRRTKDDVRQAIHLPPARLRKESDQLAQRIERLNLAMQAVNWTTELAG